MDSGVLFYVV